MIVPGSVNLERPEHQSEMVEIDHRHLVDDDIVGALVAVAPAHGGKRHVAAEIPAKAGREDPAVNRLRRPCGFASSLPAEAQGRFPSRGKDSRAFCPARSK